jgi:hypothetical protein
VAASILGKFLNECLGFAPLCTCVPFVVDEFRTLPNFPLQHKKIQAAQGEALSGLFGEVLQGRRKKSSYYIDDGLFCPAVVGVVGVVSPTVLVIKRTSTRRLSARPSLVLFDSTGLSLPSPIT